MSADMQAQLSALQSDLQDLKAAIQEVIVGQDQIIRGVLICLLSGGHGLLEGCPASAKRC